MPSANPLADIAVGGAGSLITSLLTPPVPEIPSHQAWAYGSAADRPVAGTTLYGPGAPGAPGAGGQPGGGGLFQPVVDFFGGLFGGEPRGPGGGPMGSALDYARLSAALEGRPAPSVETGEVMPGAFDVFQKGIEAVQEQYESEQERYERGIEDRERGLTELDEMRQTRAGEVQDYQRLLQEQRDAYAAEHTRLGDSWAEGKSVLGNALEESRNQLNAIIQEGQATPERVGEFMKAQIREGLGDLEMKFNTAFGEFKSMREGALGAATNQTAELMQQAGAGTRAAVRQNLDLLDNDPQFASMSPDQKAVMKSTFRLQGAVNVGNMMTTLGAQENARLSELRAGYDRMGVEMQNNYVSQTASLNNALRTTAMGEVGDAYNHALDIVAGARTARSEVEFKYASEVNALNAQINDQFHRADQDFRAWADTSRLNHANAMNSLNISIMQGNMDAFNQGQSLMRPSLAGGMASLFQTMFSLGIELQQLDIENTLARYGAEMGRAQMVAAPLQAGIQAAVTPAPPEPKGPSGWEIASSFVPSFGFEFGG